MDLTVDRSAELGMRRVARRVRLALLLGGCADAIFVLALALVVMLLVGRFLGFAPRPDAFWLILLALPAAWGLARAAREGPPARNCAAYFDRRFGLKGLLLASLERDGSAWQDDLRARVEASAATLPALRPRRLLLRSLLPLALLLAVVLLPPPEVGNPSLNPMIEEALEELEGDLQLAREEERVDEKQAQEMQRRLRELRDSMDGGETVLWNDVDALAGRLGHEEALHASRAERTRAGLEEFAAGGAAAGAPALAKLLEDARALGRLPQLTPGMLEKLGLPEGPLGPDGLSLDAKGMAGLDAEQLARLARAMADAMGGDPAQFLPGRQIDAAQLEDLRRLVQGQGRDPAHQHGPG